MPFPPFAPSVYFDDADIAAFVAEFSERVRRNGPLRAAMSQLVGNRWHDAELGMADFMAATLFMNHRPAFDADWLVATIRLLDADAIDSLAEIMLDCALVVFPLHSAAVMAEVADRLAEAVKQVLAVEGVARQKRLLETHARLTAGALMSRI